MARRHRAYAYTQGRTQTLMDLPLEALAVSRSDVPLDSLGPEHRKIMASCATPQSVVDLSALLALPLGVVRVLLADLMATGYVETPSAPTPDDQPAHQDLALLEEVLDGIESL